MEELQKIPSETIYEKIKEIFEKFIGVEEEQIQTIATQTMRHAAG